MTELTILGTGNAMVTKCYNTCFTISNDAGYFLVDAGGGNGILVQIQEAIIPWKEVRGMYLTHAHTDHLLGAVWVVRKIATLLNAGKYQGVFPIYGHKECLALLEQICVAMLTKKMLSNLGTNILFCEVVDGAAFEALGMPFQAFDIFSEKQKQFGFTVEYEPGKKLTCLGDEPYNEKCTQYATDCDWLMCEAFCMYDDREIFKPYEKYHSTAKDAGALARTLRARNVLLYHTEDTDLSHRKVRYTREAALAYYDGDVAKSERAENIFVPDDLEKIKL